MAKKKKESWVGTAFKFGAVAVAGAVIGAYGVRAVDRYFIGKYGHAPFSGGGDGEGASEDPEGEAALASNPRAQIAAIAPVIPMYPGIQAHVMPPPVLHVVGSGHAAVPSSTPEFAESNPRSRAKARAEQAAERRAAAAANFERLASRFETGEI